MQNLPLKFLNGMPIRIRNERFLETKENLEKFISDEPELCTKEFATKVMRSYEVKTNNQVEGYPDDVEEIEEIIDDEEHKQDSFQKRRIVNLHNGYDYILGEPPINKDTLKELYAILSKGLLNEKDLEHMGKFYRNGPVYIFYSSDITVSPDQGIPEALIDSFMNDYFKFLNNLDFSENITDEYIKSQILHFYFVYIHPYFDVNGRTSRTTSMWYLLLKKAYPYIIFNRGITLNGKDYNKVILDVKKYKDISYFIDYMLKTVATELEKEYILSSIAKATPDKLTIEDHQTLLYLLSMNGLLSVKDFASTYNHLHDKKRIQVIYESMINPLIQKGILEVERTTHKNMFGDYPNEILRFNPHVMEYDRDKIKSLKRYR